MTTHPSTNPRFEAQPPAATVWQAPASAADAPERTERIRRSDLPNPVVTAAVAPISPAPAAPAPAVAAPEAVWAPAMVDNGPARRGWRGRLNRHLPLSLAATTDELADRADRMRLLRPFSRAMTIVVANPKGGTAKTPITLLTAATLGFHRGGYTIAWDNNEARGTLGMRAEPAGHRRTVADLLGHDDVAGHGPLSAFLRPQSARFDVLASDNTPGGTDEMDAGAFWRVWSALSPYYRLLVIDSGNNVRAASWRAATEQADCLVIPTTVHPDAAGSGLWMLDHLIRSGHGKLVKDAVVLISVAESRTRPAQTEAVVASYRGKVRDVVVIPHDPHLREGGPIVYDRLAEATRRAAVTAAARIVDSLASRDSREGADSDGPW